MESMIFDRTIDPGRLFLRTFLKQVEMVPDASAVISGDRALTYGEIRHYSGDLAARLQILRIKTGAAVAVVMQNGWEPVVASLGILLAGGAFAPVDITGLGKELGRRLDEIGADIVVTTPALLASGLDFGRKRRVVVIDRASTSTVDGAAIDDDPKPGQLACVIHRGDAGGGRGRRVKVNHAQLAQAVQDFSKQTRIDGQDRLVSVDPFDSEAFICCVFSSLAVGGTVVLPLAAELNDPTRWLELVDDYDVTVWSSTPAAMQRLVMEGEAHPAFSLATLRLAALDCEWMPVRLPTEIERAMPGARVAAFHTDLDDGASPNRRLELIDPVWTTGLYRRLPAGHDATHHFHVLSGGLEDCAPLVPGDLYVGSPTPPPTRWPFGSPARSVAVRRPNSSESLLRTGYRARRRPDGGIEFAPWLDRKTFAVSKAPSVWWARARA